jgi:hypothetical protein
MRRIPMAIRVSTEIQPQVPIRLRSGQAFDSAEVRFAQGESNYVMSVRGLRGGVLSGTVGRSSGLV